MSIVTKKTTQKGGSSMYLKLYLNLLQQPHVLNYESLFYI